MQILLSKTAESNDPRYMGCLITLADRIGSIRFGFYGKLIRNGTGQKKIPLIEGAEFFMLGCTLRGIGLADKNSAIVGDGVYVSCNMQ